ncbi:MAG: DUF4388 domain-containing protein [Acidobacteria bacterium]|nr:DUF4388 domain-containing protein [Acidobacteriota bacterium]
MSSQKEKAVVEEAMLEVELAMRYNAHQRAEAALQDALGQFPSNTDLRWKLAELHYQEGSPHNSAEQLFIISDIYIANNQLDFAESTLLKVKQVYPAASFHVDTKLATLRQLQALSKYKEQLSAQQNQNQQDQQNQQNQQNNRYSENYQTQQQNYANQYQVSYQDSYQISYQEPYLNPYQNPNPPMSQNAYSNNYPPYQPPYSDQYQAVNQDYDYLPVLNLEPIDIEEAEIAEVQAVVSSQQVKESSFAPLAGDLHYINLFDVIQTLEKNEITGILHIQSEQLNGNLYLNRGLLADAICGDLRGKAAFKCFAEVTEGNFELEKSPVEFYQSIQAESNAKLILEIFSDSTDEMMEEENLADKTGESQELNW